MNAFEKFRNKKKDFYRKTFGITTYVSIGTGIETF